MDLAGGKVQGPETGRTRGDRTCPLAASPPVAFSLPQLLSTPKFLLRPKLLCYLLPPRPHHLPQATVPALCGPAVVMAAAPVEAFRLRGLLSQLQPDRRGAGRAQSQDLGRGTCVLVSTEPAGPGGERSAEIGVRAKWPAGTGGGGRSASVASCFLARAFRWAAYSLGSCASLGSADRCVR